MRSMHAVLRDGAAALGLALSEIQQDQLLAYLGLLQKWGRVYNLTAVRDPQEMLTHHLLDSLAVVAPIRHRMEAGHLTKPLSVLDVGSGAGLPGVVIALCCPDVSVSCVDAVAKKVAFVQQVAANLRLTNLRGIHARVESLEDNFGLVVSRAFSSLADFTRLSAKSVAPDGLWMAMKGKEPADEIAALTPDVEAFHVEQLQVPGLDAQRCLVWIRRRSVR